MKQVIYLVNSDNFENTYMTAEAYRELTLQMSSGDFGSHTKKVVKKVPKGAIVVGIETFIKTDVKIYLKELGHNPFDQTALNVANAYADCLPDSVETEGLERSLNYFSRESVKAVEIRKYLQIIGGYNGFDPERATSQIINTFGEDANVFIAREGSPCLYVYPSKNIWFGRRSEELSCDEFSFDADLGLFRVWWD